MDNPIDVYSSIQTLIKNDIDSAIDNYSDKSKYGVFPVVAHQHTGIDSQKINQADILSKMLYIPINLFGTTAATSTNYGVFFIAPFACSLVGVYESHQTKGTDGSAVTLNIEKLTGTTALDSGTTLLSAGIDLKGNINTVVSGSLITSTTTLNLLKGDRLALKDSGILTSVAGVSIIIILTY